ncbi:hypothetical protein V8G54_035029 [Vigna mungo]|uniref:Pentatricopeptide repeat-containing protein n=1 Tax=Vigna mungo TaxID=3915 RepID=A0AAQ3RF92_VIGMU
MLVRRFSVKSRLNCALPSTKVFGILSITSTPEQLKQSLKSSGVFLSNELVDQVLKRVRFSHGNPSQTLEFFCYTGRRKGFYHTTFLEEAACLVTIAKVCSVRQTVDSFRKFRKLVAESDINCFNALLRTLCQEKSMTDARNVYHSLKHRFCPNLQTFNILLSGWKTPEDVEGFLKEMKEMGVTTDVVTYNSLVDVYCKGREIEKAYKVLEEIRDRDLSPDVITYTCIIGGLGLIGQPDKGRDVLKEMKEYGCYPDAAAYNAVVRNFCIAKRLGDVNGLVEEMVSKGLSPNATTYNLFFRVFYWSNDLHNSWVMYNRMMVEGCLPNTQSCMFLIRLFRKYEKGNMVEKGFGSYTLVSDVLFDLLCDMGKLEEAEKCFFEDD